MVYLIFLLIFSHWQFCPKPRFLVRETADVYRRVVEPHIASQPASAKLWLRNIIEGKAEMERLIYADPEADPQHGFLLLPDFRWDQKNPKELYCQGTAVLPMFA
jgi:m7GpppX diphosphatase